MFQPCIEAVGEESEVERRVMENEAMAPLNWR